MVCEENSSVYSVNQTPLYKGYTFDSFKEGLSNHFALKTVDYVLGTEHFSPMFIYGDTGVGKTHLVNAIGNKIKREKPDSKVVYFRSVDFISNMVAHLQTNEIRQFRLACKEANFLIIDDVQFFSRKERCQDELSFFMEAALDTSAQVILTANAHPQSIGCFDRKLLSLMNSGLTIEINSPDIETSASILLQKAHERGITLGSEKAFCIAENVRLNGYGLTNTINNLVVKAKVLDCDISIDFILSYVSDLNEILSS